MIDITTKIHDQFSIEFKISYLPYNKGDKNIFDLDTWFFIPNSLDINQMNYGKGQFYRDVKSNVRLIIPAFPLNEIVDGEAIPYDKLQKHIAEFKKTPSDKTFKEYEYQVKMFIAICKSAIRDTVNEIKGCETVDALQEKCEFYLTNIHDILSVFRDIRSPLDDIRQKKYAERDPIPLVDEYLSRIVEDYTFRVIEKVNEKELNIKFENETIRVYF